MDLQYFRFKAFAIQLHWKISNNELQRLQELKSSKKYVYFFQTPDTPNHGCVTLAKFLHQYIQLIQTQKSSGSRPAKAGCDASFTEQFTNADLYVPNDSTSGEKYPRVTDLNGGMEAQTGFLLLINLI